MSTDTSIQGEERKLDGSSVSQLFIDSRARISSVLICASELLFFMAIYAYMSILAVYAVDLGATATIAGLAVGIYGIGQMIFRIPIGIVADVTGRRRDVIIFSLLVLMVSNIGMAMAGSPWHLVFFRLTTSIGASGYLVYAVLLAQQFMPERKGTAMGLLTGVTSAGTLIGTWVGGQLAQVGGYKYHLYGVLFLRLSLFCLLFLYEKSE